MHRHYIDVTMEICEWKITENPTNFSKVKIKRQLHSSTIPSIFHNNALCSSKLQKKKRFL